MLDLLWRVCFRWKLRPRQVTGDTTYGTTENIVAVEDAGIRAYVPLPDFDHRTRFFGKGEFTYDAHRDVYHCPGGQELRFRKHKHTERTRVYQAPPPPVTPVCSRRNAPPAPRDGRSSAASTRHTSTGCGLPRHRGLRQGHAQTPGLGRAAVRGAKDWHGLRRFRLRGLPKVNMEALLIAAGQNLKRLLSRSGWGRRPFPSGAAGVVLPALPPLPAPVP